MSLSEISICNNPVKYCFYVMDKWKSSFVSDVKLVLEEIHFSGSINVNHCWYIPIVSMTNH